jgi:hypothetical protein
MVLAIQSPANPALSYIEAPLVETLVERWPAQRAHRLGLSFWTWFKAPAIHS